MTRGLDLSLVERLKEAGIYPSAESDVTQMPTFRHVHNNRFEQLLSSSSVAEQHDKVRASQNLNNSLHKYPSRTAALRMNKDETSPRNSHIVQN